MVCAPTPSLISKVIDQEGVIKTYHPEDNTAANEDVFNLLATAVRMGVQVDRWGDISEEKIPKPPPADKPQENPRQRTQPPRNAAVEEEQEQEKVKPEKKLWGESPLTSKSY